MFPWRTGSDFLDPGIAVALLGHRVAWRRQGQVKTLAAAAWTGPDSLHRYYRTLCNQAGLIPPVSWQDLTQAELFRVPVPAWRTVDMLALMARAFDPVWPGDAGRLQRLVGEGRVRVGMGAACCVSDHKGPRVWLAPPGGRISGLFQMAHEVGHALDIMLRTEQKGQVRPSGLLPAEVRAIMAELALARVLMQKTRSAWHPAVRHWLGYRRRQLCHYQTMLHGFEQGLAALPELSVPRVSDWWIDLQCAYLGPVVQRESIPELGWLHELPLLLAGNRFQIYPRAWRQARALIGPIHCSGEHSDVRHTPDNS